MTTIPILSASTTDPSDRVALRRYASRSDPRAFECLVRRHQQMVYATCMRTLGDASEAEDAAQETFVKLARHAGTVRSNLGAWLHACARRTAIDMARSRAARRNAAHAAASAQDHAATPEDHAGYREIESRLDAALDRLSPGDRALIIERFLIGRSQADMARSARVPRGTMHRRIDRAVERLRLELPAMGVAGAGLPGLAAGLEHIARSATPRQGFDATLTKIGLAGVGPGAATTGVVIGTPLILGTIAAVLVGFVAVLLPLAPKQGAVARPKKTSELYTLVRDDRSWSDDGSMESDGRTLAFTVPCDWRGRTARIEFVVDDAVEKQGRGTMSLRLTRCEMPPPLEGVQSSPVITQLTKSIGTTYESTFAGSDGLLTIRIPDADVIWRGTSTDKQVREAPGAIAPFTVGAWVGLSDWQLTVGRDEITILRERGGPVHRFRVLEWEQAESYAKIQTICTDSNDQSIVGQRFKILLGFEDGTYILALHNKGSERMNAWPTGLERIDGDELRVMHWRVLKP